MEQGKNPPPNQLIIPIAIIVLCCENTFLLLEYSPLKAGVGKWGYPGGKLEVNENPLDGAKRELLEETGIALQSEDLVKIKSFIIPNDEAGFLCHAFKAHFETQPEIRLSNEHSKYFWAKPEDYSRLQLLTGVDKVMDFDSDESEAFSPSK